MAITETVSLECTCDVCGHNWKAHILPKRCAKPECCSIAWNRPKMKRGRPSKNPDPIKGHSRANQSSKSLKSAPSPVSPSLPSPEELCTPVLNRSNQDKARESKKLRRPSVRSSLEKPAKVAGKFGVKLCPHGMMMYDGSTACMRCKGKTR
jgi:hypothetical protein